MGLIVVVITLLLGSSAVCVEATKDPQTNSPLKCQGSRPNECDGKCVNLQNDKENCGDCGKVCRGGDICQKGKCVNPNNNNGASNNNSLININNRATCFDGIKNGDETGIDCGGSCQPCSQQVSSPIMPINNPGNINIPPGEILNPSNGTGPSSAGQGAEAPAGNNVAPVTPNQVDLTGIWGCDDGGHYYIRQLGNAVWWYGENDPNSPSFSNVFYGTISDYSPTSIITGNWADVPKGKYASSSGTLTLAIETNNKLHVTQQTGSFGGTSWVRPI